MRFFQKTVNNMKFQKLSYADDILVIAKTPKLQKITWDKSKKNQNNTTT